MRMGYIVNNSAGKKTLKEDIFNTQYSVALSTMKHQITIRNEMKKKM